jgi:hypothetical protein
MEYNTDGFGNPFPNTGGATTGNIWISPSYVPQPCPSCGHCPTCGRRGHQVMPLYPMYPQPWPFTPSPWWGIYTNATYTVSSL